MLTYSGFLRGRHHVERSRLKTHDRHGCDRLRVAQIRYLTRDRALQLIPVPFVETDTYRFLGALAKRPLELMEISLWPKRYAQR